MTHKLSLFSWALVALLVLASVFTIKEWRSKNTQHAFTYDSMGYYLYLPAFFIYHDLQHFEFVDEICKKYELWGNAYHPEKLPSGNALDKYALGQALYQLPWFLLAHLLAKPLGYPADGFSPPYQTIISLGNILMGLLALWYLRRILLRYFPDAAVACSLLLLLIATNYWCYIGFDSHMTHASLFALYVFLLWHTIQWHHNPSWASSLAIGGAVGFAVLIRPTEIVSLLIPLFWSNNYVSAAMGKGNPDIGTKHLLRQYYHRAKAQLLLFGVNYQKLIAAALVGAAFISLQLMYWKLATGHWLYYSYGNEKLQFFKAHIAQVLYGYKKGWLTYTPVMLLALLGFVPLYRRHRNLFWPVFTFFVVNFYLVSCWSVWWYGGSFGQRALVQSYAFLIIPFTAFFAWAFRANRLIWLPLLPALALCVWLNITQTFCGVLNAEGNTRTYFWQVFGKTKASPDDKKYLQIDEKLPNANYQTERLYHTGFNADTLYQLSGMVKDNPMPPDNPACNTKPDAPLCSPVLCLDTLHRRSPNINIPLLPQQNGGWLHVSLQALCLNKEWDFWKQHNITLQFMNNTQEVKTTILRPVEIMDCGNWTPITFNTEIPPNKAVNLVQLHFGDGGTSHTLYIDDVSVERLY